MLEDIFVLFDRPRLEVAKLGSTLLLWKCMTKIFHAGFGLYRGCLASSIKGDLVPCCNKGPGGREGGHVFEVLPDILCCPFQYFRFGGLSVEHISADAVVHICPKWSNKRSAVTQGESLWCELANLHVEGDHTIVVHLWTEQIGLYFTIISYNKYFIHSINDLKNNGFLCNNKSLRVLIKAYIDGTVGDIEENELNEQNIFRRTPIIHLWSL